MPPACIPERIIAVETDADAGMIPIGRGELDIFFEPTSISANGSTYHNRESAFHLIYGYTST